MPNGTERYWCDYCGQVLPSDEALEHTCKGQLSGSTSRSSGVWGTGPRGDFMLGPLPNGRVLRMGVERLDPETEGDFRPVISR